MDTQTIIQGVFTIVVALMVYSIPYVSDKLDTIKSKHSTKNKKEIDHFENQHRS